MTISATAILDDLESSSDDLVKSVAQISKFIDKSVPESRNLGRATDAMVDEFETRGLFRMGWPLDRGAYQRPMSEQHEVLKSIGRLDGSAAWLTAIYSSTPRMAALFGDELLDEYLDSAAPRASGVFSVTGTATQVTGGWRVSGRWPFCTGQHHAGWVLVPAATESGPPLALFVPRADFESEGNWKTARGMHGTGSDALTLDEAFVPSHRSTAFTNILHAASDTPATIMGDPYFRVPLVPVICALSAGPAIGMAEHAIDMFIDHAATRPKPYSTFNPKIESPLVQDWIGVAYQLVCDADRAGRAAAETIDSRVRTDTPWDDETRIMLRAYGAHAVECAAKAAAIVAHEAGATANTDTSNPFNGVLSDIEVLSRHAFLDPSTCRIEVGRLRAGLPPSTPYF